MLARFILLSAVGTGALGTGCSDQCEFDEMKCKDNVIYSCGYGGDITDQREFAHESWDCADEICIDVVDADGLRKATCRPTRTPDAECAADRATARFCVDERSRADCAGGFNLTPVPCGSDGFCVDTGRSGPEAAICAAESTPSHVCTADGQTCDGGTLVICESGFATWKVDCSSFETLSTCRALPDGEAECAP